MDDTLKDGLDQIEGTFDRLQIVLAQAYAAPESSYGPLTADEIIAHRRSLDESIKRGLADADAGQSSGRNAAAATTAPTTKKAK